MSGSSRAERVSVPARLFCSKGKRRPLGGLGGGMGVSCNVGVGCFWLVEREGFNSFFHVRHLNAPCDVFLD